MTLTTELVKVQEIDTAGEPTMAERLLALLDEKGRTDGGAW